MAVKGKAAFVEPMAGDAAWAEVLADEEKAALFASIHRPVIHRLEETVMSLRRKSYTPRNVRDNCCEALEFLQKIEKTCSREDLLKILRTSTAIQPYIAKNDRKQIQTNVEKAIEFLKDGANFIESLSYELETLQIKDCSFLGILDQDAEVKNSIIEQLYSAGAKKVKVNYDEKQIECVVRENELEKTKKHMLGDEVLSPLKEHIILRAFTAEELSEEASEDSHGCYHSGCRIGSGGTGGFLIRIGNFKYVLTCAHVDREYLVRPDDKKAQQKYRLEETCKGVYSSRVDVAAISAVWECGDNQILCPDERVSDMLTARDLSKQLDHHKLANTKCLAMKIGSRTGVTMGYFVGIDSFARSNDSGPYSDVLVIEWLSPYVPFALPGDSGSAVYIQDFESKMWRAVGIHRASVKKVVKGKTYMVSLASPLSRCVRALKERLREKDIKSDISFLFPRVPDITDGFQYKSKSALGGHTRYIEESDSAAFVLSVPNSSSS